MIVARAPRACCLLLVRLARGLYGGCPVLQLNRFGEHLVGIVRIGIAGLKSQGKRPHGPRPKVLGARQVLLTRWINAGPYRQLLLMRSESDIHEGL